MKVFLGADHRGFGLKEILKEYLTSLHYSFEDLGAHFLNKIDDYPDFAYPAALKVAENPRENRGVLICGSGVGMDIVANKVDGVRSALAISVEQVRASRRDDDTNVLTIASDYMDEETAKEALGVWLETEFENEEPYTTRIDKIEEVEKEEKKRVKRRIKKKNENNTRS